MAAFDEAGACPGPDDIVCTPWAGMELRRDDRTMSYTDGQESSRLSIPQVPPTTIKEQPSKNGVMIKEDRPGNRLWANRYVERRVIPRGASGMTGLVRGEPREFDD